MVLSQQNTNKHNIETNQLHSPLPTTSPNQGLSKSSRSIQLLLQELERVQSFQPDAMSKAYGIPKDENLISKQQPLCSPSVQDFNRNVGNSFKKAHSKGFPDSFNPRKELNMPHKEKVDKWIIQVPALPASDVGNSWENACYNPMIPTSDECIDDDENCSDFDFSGDDDIIEYQSRMITFLINQSYFKDPENVRTKEGKLIPGGVESNIFLNNPLDYTDFRHLTDYDAFTNYTLHR